MARKAGAIDCDKNLSRARLGSVKLIPIGLRKKHNLIKRRAKTGLVGGERIELDSRRNSRCDRMMRSKSFDTQEVREIGRKEAEEWGDFLVLCMGIIDVFQVEGM